MSLFTRALKGFRYMTPSEFFSTTTSLVIDNQCPNMVDIVKSSLKNVDRLPTVVILLLLFSYKVHPHTGLVSRMLATLYLTYLSVN